MKWLMLLIFIAAMGGLGYVIDRWADELFNPEKKDREAQP